MRGGLAWTSKRRQTKTPRRVRARSSPAYVIVAPSNGAPSCSWGSSVEMGINSSWPICASCLSSFRTDSMSSHSRVFTGPSVRCLPGSGSTVPAMPSKVFPSNSSKAIPAEAGTEASTASDTGTSTVLADPYSELSIRSSDTGRAVIDALMHTGMLESAPTIATDPLLR